MPFGFIFGYESKRFCFHQSAFDHEHISVVVLATDRPAGIAGFSSRAFNMAIFVFHVYIHANGVFALVIRGLFLLKELYNMYATLVKAMIEATT